MLKKIKDYYNYCKEKRYDTLAGTLSFYFILSLIPLLYLSLSLYIYIGNLLEVNTPLPEVITNYVSFDYNAGVSILFILTTIYSSSALFLQLRKTGELIYNIKKPKNGIKNIIVACGISLLVMIIIASGFLAYSIAQTYLSNKLDSNVIKILAILIIYTVIIGILFIINQHATIKKLTINEMKNGIIFTIIYIIIVTFGFAIYLNFANYDFLYGVFSTIIIFFIYVYLMMKGIVAGIIINQKNYK